MSGSRDENIRDLFPLVRAIARRVLRTIPAADFDDLVGDGCVGLIRAVDRFDAARGVPLEKYARRLIVCAMLNGIRHRDPVSERVRRTLRKASESRYRIAQERGTMPTMGEMERSSRAVKRARATAHTAAALSLDLPLTCDEPGLIEEGSDPADRVLEKFVRDDLHAAIALLPERQRRIVLLHYYYDESLHAIGRRMNVSAQRASQLHRAALDRLRSRFTPA